MMWSPRSTSTRVLSSVLAAAVAALLAPAPGLSADNAIFHGKIVAPDGVSPLEGVVVRLVDLETKAIFDSAVSNDAGLVRIETAPAGRYTLLARDGDEVFLGADVLKLDSGWNPPLALMLTGDVSPGPVPALAPAASGGGGFPLWANIVIVGAVVLTSVGLMVNATDKETTPYVPPVSPYEPM